ILSRSEGKNACNYLLKYLNQKMFMRNGRTYTGRESIALIKGLIQTQMPKDGTISESSSLSSGGTTTGAERDSADEELSTSPFTPISSPSSPIAALTSSLALFFSPSRGGKRERPK